MGDIKQAIRAQIADEFLDGRATELTDDTRLVEEEIIDSLGIFLLVAFLKESFEVEIEPDEVTLENFATVDDIAALVERKIGN